MKATEKLSIIQSELKAPKSQRNTFGNYNYRNAEDILEAVKPLLFKNNIILTLSDEMVNIGDRNYIKATAKLCIEGDSIEVYGWAREAQSQKGMNEAQITGSASSYARKYALNGLFCIDDTKDDDFNNKGETPKPKQVDKPAYKNNIETWLSESGLLMALKLTDVVELRTFIKTWTTAPKGMKKDYKEQLIQLGTSLTQ